MIRLSFVLIVTVCCHCLHPTVEARSFASWSNDDTHHRHGALTVRGGGEDKNGENLPPNMAIGNERAAAPFREYSVDKPKRMAVSPSIATTKRGTSSWPATRAVATRRVGNEKKEEEWFPISRRELPQFLSMSTLMFLFIYVFTTVRDTKDALVVSNCGAESIPFLKLYGVMPAAILFLLGYSKCSNLLGRDLLFYVTLLPFFLFYTIFAFLLYPNRDTLHFSAGGAPSLLRYWTFSLYFVVSELWASAGVPLLFWQCANDVTSLTQAKRFYPLFAVIGNLAPIVSGKVMSYIVSLQKSNDDVGFGSTLKSLSVVKLVVCFGIVLLYNVVYSMSERRVKQDAIDDAVANLKRIQKGKRVEIEFKIDTTTSSNAKRKTTPSLSESLKELSKSRELRSMATMVLCYNVCVELTEVLWKGILRKTHDNESDYMSFMATFSQKVGVIALVLQLIASNIISTLGWRGSALITPLVMGALAVPFFASVFMSKQQQPTATTLAMALTLGTWQNIASKVTKYSLFDPCKEMAYIPLGTEAKVKGKAAVDVLGARFGRSIGSVSQQLMVYLVGNILNCAPYLGIFYLVTIGVWMNAVSMLSNLFSPNHNNNNDGGTKVDISKGTIVMQSKGTSFKAKVIS